MSYLAPNPVDVRRRKYAIGGLAALFTLVIMAAFMLESRWGFIPPETKVVFAQSWPASRTGADALAERAAENRAIAAELAASRAYIATLPADKRAAAQEQYAAYVAGKGLQKLDPAAPASPSAR